MDKIDIEVKMFSKLKKFLPAGSTGDTAIISIEKGATLKDLKKFLDIPVDTFDGIVIDAKNEEIEDSYVLADGESVTFYATVAGG